MLKLGYEETFRWGMKDVFGKEIDRKLIENSSGIGADFRCCQFGFYQGFDKGHGTGDAINDW